MSIWYNSAESGDETLQRINGWSRGTMMEPLSIAFAEIGEDFLRGSMPVDTRTQQPFGLLHGGASVALAETLGSTAAILTLDTDKEVAVGLDINANHVRGVRSGLVTGTARPLHLGRSTQVWEIRIVDAQGRLACISRLTMAVVPASTVGANGLRLRGSVSP